MKRLTKKFHETRETVEAYASKATCACNCSCKCGCSVSYISTQAYFSYRENDSASNFAYEMNS